MIDLLDLFKILVISNIQIFEVFLNLNFVQCVSWNVVMATSIDWSIIFLIHLVILDLVALWTSWLDLGTFEANLDI